MIQFNKNGMQVFIATIYLMMTFCMKNPFLYITGKLRMNRYEKVISNKRYSSTLIRISPITLSTSDNFHPFNNQSSIVSSKNNCPICKLQLPSRNQLYNHLRSNKFCTESASKLGIQLNNSIFASTSNKHQRKVSTAIKISYNYSVDFREIDSIIISAIKQFATQSRREFLSITKATSFDYRLSPYLSSDNNCAAIGDTIIFSELLVEDDHKSNEIYLTDHLNIINGLNKILENSGIIILSREIIPNEYNVHAEQHCTVRVYDYLLPIEYVLPIGRNIFVTILSSIFSYFP